MLANQNFSASHRFVAALGCGIHGAGRRKQLTFSLVREIARRRRARSLGRSGSTIFLFRSYRPDVTRTADSRGRNRNAGRQYRDCAWDEVIGGSTAIREFRIQTRCSPISTNCWPDECRTCGHRSVCRCSWSGKLYRSRIGIATVKALAATLDRPCAAVPTLQAVALAAVVQSHRGTIACRAWRGICPAVFGFRRRCGCGVWMRRRTSRRGR